VRDADPWLAAAQLAHEGRLAGGATDLGAHPAAHELAGDDRACLAVAEAERADRVVRVRAVEARHGGLHDLFARVRGIDRNRPGQVDVEDRARAPHVRAAHRYL